jgi:hypothetical protein
MHSKNGATYFDRAVSYVHKMFIKLAIGLHDKTFYSYNWFTKLVRFSQSVTFPLV